MVLISLQSKHDITISYGHNATNYIQLNPTGSNESHQIPNPKLQVGTYHFIISGNGMI